MNKRWAVLIPVVTSAILISAFNNCSGFRPGFIGNGFKTGDYSSASVGGSKRIWIHPNVSDGLASDGATIFQNANQWSSVLSQTDVYQVFQASVAHISASEMNAMIQVLKNHNIDLGIESYGLLPYECGNNRGGYDSANGFINDVKPIYAAGGSVKYVSLDGSGINFATAGNGRSDNNCNYDLETAFAQLAIFITTIHKVHPEIQFGLLAGLPGLNYNGTVCNFSPNCSVFGGTDYRDVLNRQVQVIRAANDNITFVHVDSPYGYFFNHPTINNVVKDRLLPLQSQAHSLGLRFGLIINSDLGGQADNSDDLDQKSITYYNDNLNDLGNLYTNGGLTEDDFIVESWFHFPAKILDENTDYTFMNLANRLIYNYKTYLQQTGSAQPLAQAPSGGSTSQQPPISYGLIKSGVDLSSCSYFDPDKIKALDAQTIGWLGSLQPSGLTLLEQWSVAQSLGYTGQFGDGSHTNWLAQDSARTTAFNQAITALANQPMLPNWPTRQQHNLDRKSAGYLGVFGCGGDICFAAGKCDSLGRRL